MTTTHEKHGRIDLRRAMRLYVIPDRTVGAPLRLEEQARQALAGGATALQLRDKEADGGELFAEARQMLCLCRELGVPLFVNDRLDIALACGADGVHLGQNDLPVAEARRLAPRPFIIGASARTPEDADRAVRDGADYLGVGAVFPTGSKEDAQVIGLDGIRAITRAAAVPVVAIGGVSLDNLGEVMACGADGVAVISAAVRGDIPANMKRLREGLE